MHRALPLHSARGQRFHTAGAFTTRGELTWAAASAVDIVEKDNAYEVTAELPGLDEKNVEAKLVNGGLTIKGEKREEKEEKKRTIISTSAISALRTLLPGYGGVDTDKIEASFKKGALTVPLPKKPEAQKPEKKIEIKAPDRRSISPRKLSGPRPAQPGSGFPVLSDLAQ